MNLPAEYQHLLEKQSVRSFLGELGGRLEKRDEKPTRPVIPFLPWMQTYRAMLSPAQPFDLEQHHYLKALYEDDHKEVVFCKAGQIGISELLISWVLWMADQRQVNGLYVFPTSTHVTDFSMARLGPAIEAEVSPYLAKIIIGAMGKGQRGADRVGLKRVRDRFIYFRGAQVKPDGKAPQLKSIDAGCLVLDERDEMDDRAPPIARERLQHSRVAQIRIASTPTYAGTGIWQLYQDSDCRKYFLPCSACGQIQDININDLITEWDDLERPVGWNHRDQVPFIACRKCGKPIDRSSPGEWVAEYPKREVHGYHISRLHAPFKSLLDIIKSLQTTNETKRKEAYNQGLGLPYSSPTAYRLTFDILDACKRDYGMTRGKGGQVFMGVDVGKLYNVVIREKLADGSRCARFIGMVKETKELSELVDLFQVKVCVIDALPETREARKFQERHDKGKVWICYYPNQPEGSKRDEPEAWIAKEVTVNADRTRCLDEMISEFVNASRGEGGKTLPANARSLPDYYQQMVNIERRKEERSTGKEVSFYAKTGPDHYAHAENYESIAARCPLAMRWGKGV